MHNFKGWIAVLLVMLIQVRAEINNFSKVKNMVVPKGNYTQIRISGFGYGDDSLENDISQVGIDFLFKTDVAKSMSH